MSRTSAITSSTGPRPAAAGASARRRFPRPSAVTAVIVMATLVGLALRLYQLSRPGYLLGITEYDDGADFGSAIRLVNGALPYRDFIMVQPPGITLLMAPGRAADQAGRHRRGRWPPGGSSPRWPAPPPCRWPACSSGTAGLLAVTVELRDASPSTRTACRPRRTVLLEPWLVLFCLLGALAVFDGDRLASGRRLVWGGLAFGFAGAVKVWAILPVLVILVLTARRPRAGGPVRRRGRCRVPDARTAVRTPRPADLLPQRDRRPAGQVRPRPDAARLPAAAHARPHPRAAADDAGAGGDRRRRHRDHRRAVGAGRAPHPPAPPALDIFATATFGLAVVAFLWPSDFYYHYAAFLAPFLALAIALPLSRVLGAAPVTGARARPVVLLRRGAAVLAAAALAAFAVLQGVAESHLAAAIPASEISAAERIIPPGACVVTDQVSLHDRHQPVRLRPSRAARDGRRGRQRLRALRRAATR